MEKWVVYPVVQKTVLSMKNTTLVSVLASLIVGCSPAITTAGERDSTITNLFKVVDTTVIPSGNYQAELDENYVRVTWPTQTNGPEKLEFVFKITDGKVVRMVWEGGSWDTGKIVMIKIDN